MARPVTVGSQGEVMVVKLAPGLTFRHSCPRSILKKNRHEGLCFCIVSTVGVVGPSHFAGAGRDALPREPPYRLSDNDIRCSAFDRRWFPARPAQHVHRRRNNGESRIQSALASAHGRNGKRRVETCNAGRAGAHRLWEALHSTRSSDVLPRIARERVPTSH